MVRRLMLCYAVATAVCITGMADSSSDRLIVPGKSVGPITGNSTRADLVRFFGAKYVEDDYVSSGGDANSQMGTIVHRSKPNLELHVLWNEDKPERHVKLVVICPEEESNTACAWHTAEGITVGTTLKTLEKLNARPFRLMGIDWDYGGKIVSFNQGKLERLRPKCGGMTLQLEEGPGTPSEQRAAWIDEISGDKEFWSSDPAMQGVNPAVQWMSISFEECSKAQSRGPT